MNAELHKLTPEEIILKEYSDPAQINRYKNVGLWKAEEILVEKYFPMGGEILDIGCGAGRTTVALAKKGFVVTGIDLMPQMIEATQGQAQAHGVSLVLHTMDASRLAFPDDFFDGALFSFNGFESIPDKGKRELTLREVARVLRPGACFILTARSGVAFGKRWIAWVWMLFRQFILRPLRLANPNLKPGDMIRGGLLHHYVSPFTIKKALRAKGISVELFNSRLNLERARRSSFFTNFSTDNCLFYVARKH